MIDETTNLEGREQVELLQEIENSMHQYRYLQMAVFSESGKDEPDKLGKHREFVALAKEQENQRKEDRTIEFKLLKDERNKAIYEEQRRKAEERKKDKRSFVGKPLAVRGPRKERKIIQVKNEVDADTQDFLNYFEADLKTQLLDQALQNGNTDLKQKLDELAA